MRFQEIFVILAILQAVSAESLKKVLNLPQIHVDPDFVNATLIRSSNTLQLMTKTKIINLINVPDVRQATYYTCGPSCLQGVLMYYGIQEIQFILEEMTKATEEDGANIIDILRVAKEFGLKGEHHFEMTLDDLQGFLNRKIPVIVLIQAWLGNDQEDTDWQDIWDEGHYVVAIGYDDRYMYFQDPSILGGIGYISKEQFLKRWHDFDTVGRYTHYGMSLQGKNPYVPTAQYIE